MKKIITTRLPVEKKIAEELEQIVIKSISNQTSKNNKGSLVRTHEPNGYNPIDTYLEILNIINYLKIDSSRIASQFEKNDLAKIFVTESVSQYEIDKFLDLIGDKLIGIIIHTNEYYLENISLIKIYDQSEDSILENIKRVFCEDDIIDDDNKFIFEGIKGLENILSPQKIKELKDQLYKTYVTKYNDEEYFGEYWGITYRITITNGITKKDLIGNDNLNGDKILDILIENKNGTLYYDGEIDNHYNFTGIDFEPENHKDSDLKSKIREHVLKWDFDSEPILQEFLINNNFDVEILEKTFGGNKENLRE